MEYTVHKGNKYRARIRLGWIESFADNGTIADKLRFVGFTEVSVRGSGTQRIAEGRWILDDATADLPSQVDEIIVVDEDEKDA